jgi:hypothetical protein
MAEVTFDYGFEIIATKDLEAVTPGDRFRALLTMTNFDFDTDRSQTDLDDCSLDEMDGSGYARKDMTMSVAVDTTNHKVKITQAGHLLSLGALSNGTRAVSGLLVYYDPDGTDTDTQNVPVWWFPLASSQNPGGETIVWKFVNPMHVLKDLPAT